MVAIYLSYWCWTGEGGEAHDALNDSERAL